MTFYATRNQYMNAIDRKIISLFLIADLGNSPRPSPSIDSDIEKVNHILKREGHPESKAVKLAPVQLPLLLT